MDVRVRGLAAVGVVKACSPGSASGQVPRERQHLLTTKEDPDP